MAGAPGQTTASAICRRPGPLPAGTPVFFLGDVSVLSRPLVGFAGSRDASPEGIAAAGELAREAIAAGWAPVSGLARGIDTEASFAAASARVPSVAVLPCPIGSCHPASNAALLDGILESGGLALSLSAPGAPMTRRSFAERDKLTAMLCDRLIVVEAGYPSGSMHTAGFCKSAGTPLAVYAGPFPSGMPEGNRRLSMRGGVFRVGSPGDLAAFLAGGTGDTGGMPADGAAADAGGVFDDEMFAI